MIIVPDQPYVLVLVVLVVLERVTRYCYQYHDSRPTIASLILKPGFTNSSPNNVNDDDKDDDDDDKDSDADLSIWHIPSSRLVSTKEINF